MENSKLLHPLTRWRLSQDPPLSIEEVAKKANVQRSSLSKLEHGLRDTVDQDSLTKLADLGVDVLEVLRWKWTERARRATKKALEDAARTFRARAAAKRRKPEAS